MLQNLKKTSIAYYGGGLVSLEMKRISILGSTGSIGTNALSIVSEFPDQYSIVALAAGRNIELLTKQVDTFKPELVVVFDGQCAEQLRENLGARGAGLEILWGPLGYEAAATIASADLIISAMVGASGLLPTIAAVRAGKKVAIANKESLVMAGELIVNAAMNSGGCIIPVDSEHSAIFQCLTGNNKSDLDKIILTASGGPFLDTSTEEMALISPGKALCHPRWKMGRKVTIDSATLMNKGLEVIEARWLFGVPLNRIEVAVHPESIVHSMCVYRDGAVIAQLGLPDMRVPIAYAMSHPQRLTLSVGAPDFFEIGCLTFRKPDLDRFPCLGLAYQASEAGGTFPSVLSAANEVAVNAFLTGRIGFGQIDKIIREAINCHEAASSPRLEDILAADKWARKKAEEFI